MARVPRHYSDQLASSQTGPNSLDTSGADSARAIARMAGEFQQVAAVAVRQKKDALDQSEAASKKAEYVNKSALASQENQKKYAEEPEEGFEVLTQQNRDIKDEVLSTVKNDRLKSIIAADIDGLSAQQSINNKKWQIERMSAMDQQFLVDVQQMNVDTVMQGATADEYEVMLGDDTFTEENYKRAWGPEDGVKNFKTARDAMFRARATKMMEDGRFFEAQDFIQGRQEPTEKTRREVGNNFLAMQKGAEAKRFFQTVSAASVDTIETLEKAVADDMTPAQLDDRVLAVSAQAAEATDPANKKVLTDYAETLADIRDMKMEQILLTASGDMNVEANLQAQYETLFRKKNDQIERDPNAYLSDFFEFQRDVVKQARSGNVSAAKVNKWLFWSKVALQGVDPNKKKGFFGGGGVKIEQDKPVRKRLEAFLRDNRDKSVAWRMDVLQEFYEIAPDTGVEGLAEETTNALFKRAQKVATLKEAGYPIDIIDAKVIKTPAGNFNVVGEDADGMPIVDVSTMNMER